MTWAREALRGTVSSLVAPAVLLAAALLVAIGGSGADALSSLGQLTKGPDVPPTPVDLVSRDAPVGADVGQLDGRLVASAGARAAQAAQAAQRPPGAGQSGRGSAPSAAGGTGGASTPSSAVSRAPGSQGGSSGESGGGPGTTPSPTAPSAPPSSSSPSAPPRPNPVGKVLDQTKQLGDDLLKPVKPITDQVLGGLGR